MAKVDEYGAPINDMSGAMIPPWEWDGPSLGPWWDDIRAKHLIDEAFAKDTEKENE